MFALPSERRIRFKAASAASSERVIHVQKQMENFDVTCFAVLCNHSQSRAFQLLCGSEERIVDSADSGEEGGFQSVHEFLTILFCSIVFVVRVRHLLDATVCTTLPTGSSITKVGSYAGSDNSKVATVWLT